MIFKFFSKSVIVTSISPVHVLWQNTLHRFHNLVELRLSQSEPPIDAEGGEDLNVGLSLKVLYHFAPAFLFNKRVIGLPVLMYKNSSKL